MGWLEKTNRRIKEQQEAQIAGAIYDFAGYLTQQKAVTLAAPMVEHIRAWAELNGLDVSSADVKDGQTL